MGNNYQTYIIDGEGKFIEINGFIDIIIADLIMRLQTLAGEQSFNQNNGLAVKDIIEGRSLLLLEINKIAKDYTNYFDVEVGEAELDNDKQVMKINITLTFKNKTTDNDTFNFSIVVGK